MIKVIVRGTTVEKQLIVKSNRSIKSVLEEAEMDYKTGMVALTGRPLNPSELDKSFADLGVTESCYLSCIVKSNNA